MASGHLCKVRSLLPRLSNGPALRHVQPCLLSVRRKSGVSGPSADVPGCKVEIAVTSDGKTIVCHHPSADVPYEFTQPIERPNPLTNPAETHDQVLKAAFNKEVLKDKEGPTREELSKMFFTTKHRWFPVGQYHMRRRNKDPPKDR